MIAFKINDEFIDVHENFGISIVQKNPFIHFGSEIPGARVYNFSIPKTRKNRRLLHHADILGNTARVTEWTNVVCYIHKLPWKTGTIKLREVKDLFLLSFHADAGDISQKIKGRTMPGLDLGADAPQYSTTAIYPAVNHVFFPLKNLDFYGDKNVPFLGYVNYFHSGAFQANSVDNRYNRVPFPFLLYILDKTVKELGYYGITGNWTTLDFAKRVVIYNNYAIDLLNGSNINVFDSTINYNRHVPEISIGDFLIDISLFFGVIYNIDAKSKYVEIVQLDEVLDDATIAKVHTGDKGFEPNDANGYYFKSIADSIDKLLEQNSDWLTYKVGNGMRSIETKASTLNVSSEVDSINARTWTLPSVKSTGSSPEFDLGLNRSSLRFLFFSGESLDSLGNAYPQGHYLYSGKSLRWEGAGGLVENYTKWMAFWDAAEKVDTDLQLSLPQFLNLNVLQRLQDHKNRYLIDEVEGTINSLSGLGSISAKLYTIGT